MDVNESSRSPHAPTTFMSSMFTNFFISVKLMCFLMSHSLQVFDCLQTIFLHINSQYRAYFEAISLISGVYPRSRMETDQNSSVFVFDGLVFFNLSQLYLNCQYTTNDTHHFGSGESLSLTSWVYTNHLKFHHETHMFSL